MAIDLLPASPCTAAAKAAATESAKSSSATAETAPTGGIAPVAAHACTKKERPEHTRRGTSVNIAVIPSPGEENKGQDEKDNGHDDALAALLSFPVGRRLEFA